jgi:hypothetical protein
VRTGQTAREKNTAKTSEEQVIPQPEKDLTQMIQDTLWIDPMDMAELLERDILKQLSSSLPSQSTSGSTQEQISVEKPTVLTFGLDTRLMDLKTRFGTLLNWGEQFAIVTPDDKVLQLAWKDAQTVLFMLTVSTPQDTIIKPRKRP